MNPGEQMRVTLRPVAWVRLPGTAWEVYLHGKPGDEGVEIVRTFARSEFGGWDVQPVLPRVYMRAARG